MAGESETDRLAGDFRFMPRLRREFGDYVPALAVRVVSVASRRVCHRRCAGDNGRNLVSALPRHGCEVAYPAARRGECVSARRAVFHRARAR